MIPIFDGHIDTLTRLYSLENGKDYFFQENEDGHLDYPRVMKGNLMGALFSIFVPAPKSSKESNPYYGMRLTKKGYKKKLASPIDTKYAKEYTKFVLDFLIELEESKNEKIKIIKDFNTLQNCVNDNQLAIIQHIEGAEAINPDLSNLETLYQEGLRSLGLVWSRPNIFGTGVPFEFPNSPDIGPGLTDEGRELVKKCNSLGILIDLAHMNEKGFWDVANYSDFPLVVSHAGVHSICPSTRNLTDAQIDAIGDTNGIIGVMFEPTNIRRDGKPNKNTPLSMILEHIEYIVQRIGIDHVGIGSDFDGAKMPNSIKDVSYLPSLIRELKERGYHKKSIEKIAYKNWLRTFKDTWHT